jgi:hypothetical protein
MCWTGIPEQVRLVVWQILLGILPSKKAKREAAWNKKRSNYRAFITQYIESDSTSAMKEMMLQVRVFVLLLLMSKIKKDVPRTMTNIPMFQIPAVQQVRLLCFVD